MLQVTKCWLLLQNLAPCEITSLSHVGYDSSMIEMHNFTLTSLMKVCNDGKTVGNIFFQMQITLQERNNKGNNCYQGEKLNLTALPWV